MVGLLWEKALLCIVHLLLQFKERKARVLQTSLWILVDHCVDGVSSNCYCKFVYVLHLSFFAANWTRWSDKVWIHACHAQLLILFNIYVFHCLKRIQSCCLPSLAPPLSFLIIHLRLRHQRSLLPCPKDPPAKTVLNPRTLNCTPSKLPPKTPKIFKSTSLINLLA